MCVYLYVCVCVVCVCVCLCVYLLLCQCVIMSFYLFFFLLVWTDFLSSQQLFKTASLSKQTFWCCNWLRSRWNAKHTTTSTFQQCHMHIFFMFLSIVYPAIAYSVAVLAILAAWSWDHCTGAQDTTPHVQHDSQLGECCPCPVQGRSMLTCESRAMQYEPCSQIHPSVQNSSIL